MDRIAMPHCRSESIDTPVILGCTLDNPALWSVKPEKVVDRIFMIISPKQKPDEHIQALKALSHALKFGKLAEPAVPANSPDMP